MSMTQGLSLSFPGEVSFPLGYVLLFLLCGNAALPLDCKDKTGPLSSCTSISQEKLLDRIIELAELISHVSVESCALFEEMFIQLPVTALKNREADTCVMKSLSMLSPRTAIQQISEDSKHEYVRTKLPGHCTSSLSTFSRIIFEQEQNNSRSNVTTDRVTQDKLKEASYLHSKKDSWFDPFFVDVACSPHVFNGLPPCPTFKDKWILHAVLVLIQSWVEPLVNLQSTLDRDSGAQNNLVNRTKWVIKKLLSLEQGVMVLIRKMLDNGTLMPSVYDPEVERNEVQPIIPESIFHYHHVLLCFKKDAHKMETFLKLLRCRQTDRVNCALL